VREEAVVVRELHVATANENTTSPLNNFVMGRLLTASRTMKKIM
jgi:hypothetical protein